MTKEPDWIITELKPGKLIVRVGKMMPNGGCMVEEHHFTPEVAKQLRDKLNFLFPIRESIISLPAKKPKSVLIQRKTAPSHQRKR